MHLKYSCSLIAIALLVLVQCQSSPYKLEKELQGKEKREKRKKGEKAVEPLFIRHQYLPGELTKLCQKAIEDAAQKLDLLVQNEIQNQNFENTLLAFESFMAKLGDSVNPLVFMGYVSQDQNLSKEASECEQKVQEFSVSVFTRKDLYQCIKRQKAAIGLNAQEKRLLEETLASFEKNGLYLNDAELEKLRALKKELVHLETKFSTHLNQDRCVVEFTASELEGVASDFLESLIQTPEGKYQVTTKEPHFERVIENAIQSETRRRMLFAFENRAAQENTVLLEKALLVRQKIARLLGYHHWFDYRTKRRMGKNAQTVSHFLNDLKNKLSEHYKKDLKKLLALKKEQDPSSNTLKAWDLRYFSNLLKKRDLKIDEEKVREYFPVEKVVSGMFHVYSQLLGIEFIEKKNQKTWAPQVFLYEVRDAQSHETIGSFYTDFFPRPGKYGHAAAFSLISGRMLEKGIYQHPISAIVANFTPAEGLKPFLLKHFEVRTLFHEFGHIMHQVLTKAPYASLSGSNVDQDFVEAPSQMLENWVFSEEILSLISSAYNDSSKKLPLELLKSLKESRDFNQGSFYMRQLFFGLLDLTYHTAEGPVDVTHTYKSLYKAILAIDPIEGSHFPASFGHLMGGYDAGYYGYLWSQVFSEDIFTKFQKKNLLSQKVGVAYRKAILEKGKMQDASELLFQFLGRVPSTQPFYQRLGIQ